MLSIEIDESIGALLVTPDGRLTKAEVAHLGEQIETYVNEHDATPALVIHAVRFLGWEDFGALVKHIRVVHDHHKLISKVAIVSDSTSLTLLPHLADHFVAAQLRHFGERRLEEARVWVSDPAAPPGKIEWIDGLPRDVVALSASGTITARDYEETILPEIDLRLKEHDRVKLLYHLGDAFDGCSAGAVWDDARYGLVHLADFSRIALVSDVDWIRHSMKLFAPLARGQVHVFHNDELDEAKRWIKA